MNYTSQVAESVKLMATNAKEYVENKIELQVLKSTDKMSKTFAALGIAIIGIAIGMLILTLLMFGAAAYINTVINSNFWGFILIALGLTIVTIPLLFMFKQNIKHYIINTIINIIDND